MRARSVGVDRGWLGSQAFKSASAFNANIGAWNTASVSNMFAV
jgi:surface protein